MDQKVFQLVFAVLGGGMLVASAFAPVGAATTAIIAAGTLLIGVAIPAPGKVSDK